MHRRNRLFRHVHVRSPGSAPGTLLVPQEAKEFAISLTAYDEENIVEQLLEKPEDIKPFLKKWPNVWVNVDGLSSAEVLEKLGSIFNLHILAMEDILDVHHRPKIEEYDEHLFIIVRMASIRDDVLDMEQVSLFVGKNFVLTFQERKGDVFNPVRERMRKKRQRFVQQGYLAYALIDAVIDGYFPVLEHYTDKLNELEDTVISRPSHDFIELTHDTKHDLQIMRHGIWPMREVLNRFSGDIPFIHDETRLFLRDSYDHVIQVIDIMETYRERVSGLMDIYLSSLSNKMNEVMKVLTIIATIFIPLGFIAGLYGMNFDPEISPFNMPELRWYFGYPFALGLMAFLAGGLMWYFWRKGWLSSGSKN